MVSYWGFGNSQQAHRAKEQGSRVVPRHQGTRQGASAVILNCRLLTCIYILRIAV
jgi:hypothetical protein